MEIYKQTTATLNNRPWREFIQSESFGFRFVFTFPDRGEYFLTVSKRAKERMNEVLPVRVHIWMSGPHNNPDLFVPMVVGSPRIEDFDLLRLRREDEVW